MMSIWAHSFGPAWVELLSHLRNAAETTPRGFKCWEEDCVALRVSDLHNNILVHPKRKLNYRFMVAEWTWIARGWDCLSEVARYNPKMVEFSDDGVTLAGAYGPRLMPQWDWLKAELANTDSRRAVATIWTPSPAPSKDIPCTVALQFLLRDGRLNLIVTMRSSDVWLGLPYDMFCFSQLTSSMAGELGCATGWIQFNLGSSHLYERNEEAAIAVLDAPEEIGTVSSPPLPGLPPFSKHLDEPWATYSKILHATKTSKEALRMLYAIAPKS